MAVITKPRDRLPGPSKDPKSTRADQALLYSGLVAFTALLVLGMLSVMAVLPMIVPGYMAASITSESMTPTLSVGDVVIASDHDGTGIVPGTVIVYDGPRGYDLVTHRVVSTTAEGLYVTRGDGTGFDDGAPLAAASIRSKAQWIVPFVGLPRVWVAQRQWALVFLTFAVTALALWLSQFAFDPRYDPWTESAGRYQRPLHPSLARSHVLIDVPS
ncbi:MAG: signal peptidase I [bacterium]|nr:signal peptidase I [bacterium]